jgi:hypothetical protein
MKRTWIFTGAVFAAVTVATTLSALGPAVAEEPAKPAFVGPDNCKKCHLKQFKSWKATAMAKSFEALKPGTSPEKKKAGKLDPAADYTKDPNCLRCHTTGYGKETGYPAVVVGKEWTEDEKARATRLEGTTCEACHGPGSLYGPYKKDHEQFKLAEVQALGSTSPPQVEQCMACHVKECPTMPADYAWDFEKGKKSKDVHEHIPLRFPH